jgi:hypothetical protein
MRNTSRRRPNKINLLRKDEKEKKNRERERKRKERGRERENAFKKDPHTLSLSFECMCVSLDPV